MSEVERPDFQIAQGEKSRNLRDPELLPITEGPDISLEQPCHPFDFAHPPAEPLWLAKSLAMTMKAANGSGLAAVQCGFPYRAFVIKIGSSWRAHFNPEIEPQLGAMASDVEGCLSFPGLRISVTRPTRIVANFQSEFGQPRHVVYTDQDARKFLHEFDHLYGLTLYGRAERAKERGAFVQVGERMRIADGRI